jgi:hypothetical protein
MVKSIKNFLLESAKDKDEDFAYFDRDVVSKVKDVDFDKKKDYILITFSTTYGKDFKHVSSLIGFQKWLDSYLKSNGKKDSDVFRNYLMDFFESSKEAEKVEELTEIIDDTNEIMPDEDLPSNSSNRMIGANHTMDLEKIFKRSMPKSVRNYSGNLGLGTVVW